MEVSRGGVGWAGSGGRVTRCCLWRGMQRFMSSCRMHVSKGCAVLFCMSMSVSGSVLYIRGVRVALACPGCRGLCVWSCSAVGSKCASGDMVVWGWTSCGSGVLACGMSATARAGCWLRCMAVSAARSASWARVGVVRLIHVCAFVMKSWGVRLLAPSIWLCVSLVCQRVSPGLGSARGCAFSSDIVWRWCRITFASAGEYQIVVVVSVRGERER